MYKFFFIPLFLILNARVRQGEALIKWTEDYRLNYSDFKGTQAQLKDSADSPDTMAVCGCYIKYGFKFAGRRTIIAAYAVMDPKKSWMKVKIPYVLRHEQGHFDITEIYARRFEKAMNDTTIDDPHEYFAFFNDCLKDIIQQLQAENDKYDAWTRNTPGRDYYYKWISDQLALSSGK